ncbi:hypothetical protein [Sulfitobacter sp. SK012]|uniref:hypothetical protein n=1 Tax=Sulfitobacter sp. SK012 TaxID=1389005 RepID=UPI0013B3D1C4|nr:hypothetical protein [Sulfitobacter sp. SK012]
MRITLTICALFLAGCDGPQSQDTQRYRATENPVPSTTGVKVEGEARVGVSGTF